MNIDKIASIAAPVMTPFAPAVTLMAGLHAGMVATGVSWWAALVPAAASGIGMEMSGMLAGAMTFRAVKERDWVGGALAALGVVGYVWFAWDGMGKIPNSGVFKTFVLMSLISYFSAAIYQYFEDKRTRTHAQVVDQVSLIKAQTSLQRAQNKGAKIVQAVQPVQPGGQLFAANPAQVQQIRAYWAANPSATTRQVARACQCSPTTASKYKP